MIGESEYRALAAQRFNRIPLVLETLADLDTPLSLYLKLAQRPYSFLLESVVGGERFGRYSFIGLPARILIRARGTAIEVKDGGTIVERHAGDPPISSARTWRAFARRRCPLAALFGGSPAVSVTTPSAHRVCLRARAGGAWV
jgi:anthranilate synthase component 1